MSFAYEKWREVSCALHVEKVLMILHNPALGTLNSHILRHRKKLYAEFNAPFYEKQAAITIFRDLYTFLKVSARSFQQQTYNIFCKIFLYASYYFSKAKHLSEKIKTFSE